eukprot:10655638-Alexandrium_andersonii.AAC.1
MRFEPDRPELPVRRPRTTAARHGHAQPWLRSWRPRLPRTCSVLGCGPDSISELVAAARSAAAFAL